MGCSPRLAMPSAMLREGPGGGGGVDVIGKSDWRNSIISRWRAGVGFCAVQWQCRDTLVVSRRRPMGISSMQAPPVPVPLPVPAAVPVRLSVRVPAQAAGRQIEPSCIPNPATAAVAVDPHSNHPLNSHARSSEGRVGEERGARSHPHLASKRGGKWKGSPLAFSAITSTPCMNAPSEADWRGEARLGSYLTPDVSRLR